MILHIRIYIDKNHVSCNYIYVLSRIYKHMYGIIGADAVGLPVLFTDCVKVIGSSGALSYLRGD